MYLYILFTYIIQMSKINQNNGSPIISHHFNKKKQIRNKNSMLAQNDTQHIDSSRKVPVYYNKGERSIHNNHSYTSKQPKNQSYYQGSSFQKDNQDYSKAGMQSQYFVQEKIIKLNERLKNLHQYYQSVIMEQKGRTQQRSQVIISLVEQLQVNHNKKISQIREMIQSSDQQKKDVCFVDDKMTEIKSNIQYLISESDSLKSKNEQLKKKIQLKSKQNKQKENQLQEMNRQMLQYRGQLQKLQINNIKNNKVNKEITQILTVNFSR